MPGTPFVVPSYGAPGFHPALVDYASATANGGPVSLTFARAVPQRGDLIVAAVGSSNDFGAFNAAQPGDAYPSGGGVTTWKQIMYNISTGGTQICLGMWVGVVEDNRQATSRAVSLDWTANGGGGLMLFRGLDGIVRDSDLAINLGSGSTSLGPIGGTWAREGIIVAASAINSTSGVRATANKGVQFQIPVSNSWTGSYTGWLDLYWGRYWGDSVTITCSSGGRSMMGGALIH